MIVHAPVYPRISDAEAEALFRRIYLRCEQAGKHGPPVVVLDLDGTLMDNRPRSVAILQDLGEMWRDHHPQASATLRASTNESLAYLLTDTLRRLGIVDPTLVAEAHDYWRTRFFSDEDLRHDVAIAGAVAFVLVGAAGFFIFGPYSMVGGGVVALDFGGAQSAATVHEASPGGLR